ncbi:ribosome assembly factor SBDS [Candidatus Woesearchaeota archaeon]|nr:ribosome assembly factor SBDS [Candidatus Woesearchaeota archaeon]
MEMDFGSKERVHLNLAIFKKGGERFEIAVEPELALKFKRGEKIDIREIVHSDKIFSDVQKGLLASEHRLKDVFKTTDPYQIAEIMIKEGEIQLTAEYRAKLREQKRKKIINLIQKYGVDPRTKAPHTLQRIEAAFEEAKIKVDEHQRAEDQVKEILDKLKPILPISFEKKQIRLNIPAQTAAKCYSTVKNLGTILKEEWKNDGSWEVLVEIPGGLETELYDKLNSITHGQMTAEVMK